MVGLTRHGKKWFLEILVCQSDSDYPAVDDDRELAPREERARRRGDGRVDGDGLHGRGDGRDLRSAGARRGARRAADAARFTRSSGTTRGMEPATSAAARAGGGGSGNSSSSSRASSAARAAKAATGGEQKADGARILADGLGRKVGGN